MTHHSNEQQAVFALSLVGPKQDSSLALHTCWEMQDVKDTWRGPGAPPPIMVMIAAMLRSDSLDAVRATPQPTKSLTNAEAAKHIVFQQVVECVAQNDAEGCLELKPPTVDGGWQGLENSWAVNNLIAYVIHTVLTKCVDTLICTGHVTAFGAAMKVLYAFCEPLRPHCRSEPPVLPDPHVGYRAAIPPIVDLLLDCARCNGVEGLLNVETLDAVVAQHNFSKCEREAKLPMGDLRCLLLNCDASEVVTRLLRLVRSGRYTADVVVNGVAELRREDVAAMLFAALGMRTKTVWLTEVQRDARAAEMRFYLTQHFKNGPLTSQGLLVAHSSSGGAVARVASPASVEQCHLLLQGQQRFKVGSAAYDDLATFKAQWGSMLRGILDGWDWSHCVAAAGAVVRALVGTAAPQHDIKFDGDVDLFFFGLSYSGVRERLRALERHVRDKVGEGHYAVLLTSRTMSIVMDKAPRLQVTLGMWSTVSHVLMNVDVDCCGAGYNGSIVLMTGRAAASYASRVNVASATRHMVRGSIEYEMRLWKYAQRYGFAVMDPLHWTDDEVVETERVRLRDAFTSRPDRAAKRVAATTLSGLRWLMAVDLGLFTPTEPPCDLAVGDGVTLSKVLDTVLAAGYVESDNYGTDEEGYVLVGDDEQVPAEGERLDDVPLVDNAGYFHCYDPVHRSHFANCVGLSDMEAFGNEELKADLWRLC